MKSYFIILFSLVVFTAKSQSAIELFYDGNIVNDEDTLTFNAPLGDSDYYFDIVNTSANDIALEIRREIIYLVPETENWFCFTTCWGPEKDDDSGTLLAGDTIKEGEDPAFHAAFSYTNGNGGTSIVKYTFYDNDNPLTNRVSVILKFVTTGVGICNFNQELVSVFDAYPNPASSNVVIKHNFTNQNVNNAQIVLTSLTGAVVETIAVNPSENETTIDVSRLSQGVYFYSLKTDGKTTVTKKLVVK